MKKLRTFLAGLLLMPLLIANANAFTTDVDDAIANPPQTTGWCYYYLAGRWWLLPC